MKRHETHKRISAPANNSSFSRHGDHGETRNALPRVNAFTFRGDTRPPNAIRTAGGFNPPLTRTDGRYVQRVVKPAFQSDMQRRYRQNVSDADFTIVHNQVAPPGTDQRSVEIAPPERLPWAEVFGFRQLDAARELAGPIYLRKGFAESERAAFAEVYALLSGKPQH